MRALLPSIACATALAACAGEGKAPPRPEAGAPADTGESPVDPGAGAVDCAEAPRDCDLQDNDCDGEIDEGAEVEARIWVGVDADDDGWAAGPVVLACPGTGGASTSLLGPGDCDDDEPRFNPGAEEICRSAADEDCDGEGACGDPDCALAGCPEDCADGLDNDLDGLADCEDVDCVDDCGEDCRGLDGDRDGLNGCDDPDCGLLLHCWTDQRITAEALTLRRLLAVEPRSGATAFFLRQDLAAELLRIDGVAHTAAGAPLPCSVELRDLAGDGAHAVLPSSRWAPTYHGSAFSGSTLLPVDLACPTISVLDLRGLAPDPLPSPRATWALEPGALFTVLSVAQATRAGGGGSLLQLRIASPATYTVTPFSHTSTTWDRWAEQTITGPLSLAPHP